jgi:hypothetical protein
VTVGTPGNGAPTLPGAPPKGIKVSAKFGEPALRVSFAVTRETGPIPPKCEIAVWGLSRETRGRLEQTPELPCTVDAGYSGAASNLFTGVLRKSSSVREGADWIWRASVIDGDKPTGQKASLTIAKGTPLKDVLVRLVKAAGLKPGNSSLLGIPFVSEVKYASGTDKLEKSLSVYGDAMDELAYFCASVGVIWAREDGAFKGSIAGTHYTVVLPTSKETGLIEPLPKIDDKGHAIGTSLLRPDIRPGVLLPVKSATVNGSFIIVQTKHIGDPHVSNDWRVEWRGVPPGSFGKFLSERFRIQSP